MTTETPVALNLTWEHIAPDGQPRAGWENLTPFERTVANVACFALSNCGEPDDAGIARLDYAKNVEPGASIIPNTLLAPSMIEFIVDDRGDDLDGLYGMTNHEVSISLPVGVQVNVSAGIRYQVLPSGDRGDVIGCRLSALGDENLNSDWGDYSGDWDNEKLTVVDNTVEFLKRLMPEFA